MKNKTVFIAVYVIKYVESYHKQDKLEHNEE